MKIYTLILLGVMSFCAQAKKTHRIVDVLTTDSGDGLLGLYELSTVGLNDGETVLVRGHVNVGDGGGGTYTRESSQWVKRDSEISVVYQRATDGTGGSLTFAPTGSYEVESSVDLVTWSTVTATTTVDNGDGSLTVTVPSLGASGYYRVREITSSKLEPITILAMGQSNMARLGVASGFSKDSADLGVLENVKIFNTTTLSFEAWDLNQPAQNDNLGNDGVGGQNNTIAYHFARRLHRLTGRTVQVIASAANGRDIELWDTGAERWVEMVAQVNDSSITSVDIVLWMQGENNNTDLATDYVSKLQNLRNRVVAESWANDSLPWVCGTMSTAFDGILDAYAILKDDIKHPNFLIAETTSYPTTDGIHFTSEAIRDMGENQFWNAYVSGSQALIDDIDISSKIKGAYYFDTENQVYIDMPSASLSLFQNDFTVRFYSCRHISKTTDPTDWNYLLSIGRSSLFNGLFGVRYNGNGLNFWVDDFNQRQDTSLVITTSQNYGELAEIYLTRRASDGRVQVFFEKELVGEHNFTTGTLSPASVGHIGAAYDPTFAPLNGFVSNFTVWDRLLSDSEINLVQYPDDVDLEYRADKFNFSALNEIPDYSTNNYHGDAKTPASIISDSWKYNFHHFLSN